MLLNLKPIETAYNCIITMVVATIGKGRTDNEN